MKPSGNSRCLSQHHHPKAGEIIELTNCALAASHDTDKWNVYWPSGGGGSGGWGGGGGGGGGGDNDNDKDNNDDGGGGGNRLTQRGRGCSRTNPCGKLELHKTMIASFDGDLLNAGRVLCSNVVVVIGTTTSGGLHDSTRLVPAIVW